MVFECGIFQHSDQGSLGTVEITTGCDYDYQIHGELESNTLCDHSCNPNPDLNGGSDDAPTESLPATPSTEPTPSPITYSPTVEPEQCLSSPQAIRHGATGEDIEWETVSENTYAVTFVFDVAHKSWYLEDEINAQITTRLFNHSLPSPTIRMKRGNQYQVTILNKLGPESENNPVGMNVARDPNTTNIHIVKYHTLFFSDESHSD